MLVFFEKIPEIRPSLPFGKRKSQTFSYQEANRLDNNKVETGVKKTKRSLMGRDRWNLSQLKK